MVDTETKVMVEEEDMAEVMVDMAGRILDVGGTIKEVIVISDKEIEKACGGVSNDSNTSRKYAHSVSDWK